MMRVMFVAKMQNPWKSLQDTGPKKVHHLEASEGEPPGDSQVLDPNPQSSCISLTSL